MRQASKAKHHVLATQVEAVARQEKCASAEVPNTLDLTAMAELAIQGITRMLNQGRDFQIATNAGFDRRPPVIDFSNRAPVCEAKHLEALPLLRITNGSTFSIEAGRNFMQSLLRLTAEDGAIYTPLSLAQDPHFRPPFEEPYGLVEAEGRIILTLCIWYQRDKNPLWRTLVEKKIKRLTELAVEEEDFIL